jgi:hypothetical protein
MKATGNTMRPGFFVFFLCVEYRSGTGVCHEVFLFSRECTAATLLVDPEGQTGEVALRFDE